MNVSQKSWHYKLVHVAGETPNDLCTYFWTLVRNVIIIGFFLSPFVASVIICIGYDLIPKYVVTEKLWNDGEVVFKTAQEREADKLAQMKNMAEHREWEEQQKKNQQYYGYYDEETLTYWIYGILGIFEFLIFLLLYYQNIKKISAGVRNKVMAFTIIPSIVVVIGFLYGDNAYNCHNDIGDIGLLIFAHLILVTVVWAVFQACAVIVAGKLRGKMDGDAITLVTEFIQAKKQKVCPIIKYVESKST